MLNIVTAVSSLIQASTELKAADSEMISWWEPDQVAPTVRMAGFGARFAASFDLISESERERILELIEQFLEEGDDTVKDSVATGFLEALLAESSAGRFDFSQIETTLGPKSRAYCRAWNRFTGAAEERGVD
jgi:hypothetical protein